MRRLRLGSDSLAARDLNFAMIVIMIIHIVYKISSEYSSDKDLSLVACMSLDTEDQLDIAPCSQVFGDAPRG
jgi:hypothetical protein